MPATAPPRTDLDALLACVLAEPEDDAPRLVLADWYDEHGQGERAEFIRVQVELAEVERRLSEMGNPDRGKTIRRLSKRAAALRGRERALLEECGRRWSPVPTWVCRVVNDGSGSPRVGVSTNERTINVEMEYRRGFVARVELTTAAFLGGPCGRCAGTRMVPDEEGQAYDERIGRRVMIPRQKFCPDCHGQGTVAGLAAALFAAHPVERVVLTDRTPRHHPTGPWRWWWNHDTGEGRPDEVPDPLYEHPDIRYHFHDSEKDAHTALSAACVRYGRAAAGFG